MQKLLVKISLLQFLIKREKKSFFNLMIKELDSVGLTETKRRHVNCPKQAETHQAACLANTTLW